MNVEMSFVKTENREEVLLQVATRLNQPPDPHGRQPDWGLPSSYDAILAHEEKRKIAVSPLQNGWVGLIESKEVVDFAFMQLLGDRLRADVIVIQLYDVVGACGHVLYRHGAICEQYFSEEDDDPFNNIRNFIKRVGIPFDLMSFREAVQARSSGWVMLNRTVTR